MPAKQIDLSFEIKELSDQGTFAGLASTYHNVDLGGDVMRPGAFTKTIRESKRVPILFGHDSEKVIGEGVLKDTEDGLAIEGQLDIDIDPLAAQTHQKMKRGRIRGLSIGFSTVKDAIKDGIRELLEVKVWEVSLTPFPMNPLAQITAVKESALSPETAVGTPATEPPKTEEKAAEPPAEPVIDHSLAQSITELFKGA